MQLTGCDKCNVPMVDIEKLGIPLMLTVGKVPGKRKATIYHFDSVDCLVKYLGASSDKVVKALKASSDE